jgi:hypothetical protein
MKFGLRNCNLKSRIRSSMVIHKLFPSSNQNSFAPKSHTDVHLGRAKKRRRKGLQEKNRGQNEPATHQSTINWMLVMTSVVDQP